MRLLTTPFDLVTGLSGDVEPIRRNLSEMAGMYADQAAFDAMVAGGDPLVYEFYDLGVPSDAGEIAFGTSITYPGKVGAEYFMTKGHFHSILETAEVYYCLSGEGQMMMENPEGDWKSVEMSAGTAVYVPARYAHRSINTSATEPLVTFFAFRGDAGHDYGTIEEKGYRNLLVERDGQPVTIENPKWGADPETA
ncbi:MAG: cupin domain-containing protein [Phycisphaerales bacterium]|jgi:glucose-6-phosphate isomerase, archaeal|nr:cupin domain-containing protein [Phycisphaerales bacterium]